MEVTLRVHEDLCKDGILQPPLRRRVTRQYEEDCKTWLGGSETVDIWHTSFTGSISVLNRGCGAYYDDQPRLNDHVSTDAMLEVGSRDLRHNDNHACQVSCRKTSRRPVLGLSGRQRRRLQGAWTSEGPSVFMRRRRPASKCKIIPTPLRRGPLTEARQLARRHIGTTLEGLRRSWSVSTVYEEACVTSAAC